MTVLSQGMDCWLDWNAYPELSDRMLSSSEGNRIRNEQTIHAVQAVLQLASPDIPVAPEQPNEWKTLDSNSNPIIFPKSRILSLAHWEQHFDFDVSASLDFYIAVSALDLEIAFVLTQQHAALRRIRASKPSAFRDRVIEFIVSGKKLATVGISHLTTSRQHVRRETAVADRDGNDWILNGTCPWVTSSCYADYLVVGATSNLETLEEVLFLIDEDCNGFIPSPPFALHSLTNSCTGPVSFHNTRISSERLLHGPIGKVVEYSTRTATKSNSSTVGGLHTSALAIGHAWKAIDFLRRESLHREELIPIVKEWIARWNDLRRELMEQANGVACGTSSELRKKANDLAIDSSHAALISAKGAGFVSSNPVSRWCAESLFFLVWSCPNTVLMSHQNCYAGIN